jgi:hypothetical protein
MPEWPVEFATWFKAVVAWWIRSVGGSLVAVFQICYALKYKEAPPTISWCLLGLCFVIAGFLAWRDERKKVKDLTHPALWAHIISVGIGNTSQGAGITILLQITNTGPPTIADAFVAIINSKQFPTVHLLPGSKFSDEAGNVARISPADMLYEKLRNPIPEGGRVSGFLFFIAKGMSGSDLTATAKRPEIAVRFRDATRKEYSAVSIGPGQTQPLYEPGVVDPFISLYSSKRREESPAEKHVKDKRRRLEFAKKLALVMDKGRELASRCADTDASAHPSEEEIGLWTDSVYVELGINGLAMSEIYVARYNAAQDMSGTVLVGISIDRSRDYKWLMSKVNVLGEFIRELTQPS